MEAGDEARPAIRAGGGRRGGAHPALDVAHAALLPAHEELVLVFELGRLLRRFAETVEVQLSDERGKISMLEVSVVGGFVNIQHSWPLDSVAIGTSIARA